MTEQETDDLKALLAQLDEYRDRHDAYDRAQFVQLVGLAAAVIRPLVDSPAPTVAPRATAEDEKEKDLTPRVDKRTDADLPVTTASTVAPDSTRRPCVFGEYCSLHDFVHGAEAEELRERFEKLLAQGGGVEDYDVQAILDEVDARDSLAYLEWRKHEGASS